MRTTPIKYIFPRDGRFPTGKEKIFYFFATNKRRIQLFLILNEVRKPISVSVS